jgi:hypothetical protein
VLLAPTANIARHDDHKIGANGVRWFSRSACTTAYYLGNLYRGPDARPFLRGAASPGGGAGTTTTSTTSSTTSTTSSTTTTSTSTSTTTTVSVGGAFLDFTTGTPGGICGNTLNGTGGLIKNLTCGGLNVGGGGSNLPEGPTPDGATNRFTLSCTGPTCTIGAFTTTPPPNSADPDCSTTGCNFGAPLEIPNAAIPALSTCMQTTWSAPASGTLDLSTGAQTTNVALSSAVFFTANLAQPCPRCGDAGGVPVSGSPGSPGTGTCNRGPNLGQPCTTTNSVGLTRDCPTDALDGDPFGVLLIHLSPLTTGTGSVTSPTGIFCPARRRRRSAALAGLAATRAAPSPRTARRPGP